MFTDYLNGKIKYDAQVPCPEKFLNCTREYVSLKDITLKENGEISFFCFCGEEEMLERKLSDNNGKIQCKKVYGFPVLKKKLKRRSGILTGLILSAVLLFLSTLFVWDIRVKGNETITDDEILDILEDAGFKEGNLIRNTDVEKIANRVLINEDRLSWIAINFEGTVATAEVKEAAVPKMVEKKENVNIVASNNGIIMRVDALDGDAQVKAGESVYKGQLLISPFSNKRTGGSILKGAKGFVWAATERNFRVNVPLEYYEMMSTGDKRIVYTVNLLGKSFDFSLQLPKGFKKSLRKREELNMKLSDNIVLPFACVRRTQAEYVPYKKRRTEKDALESARITAKECLYRQSPAFRIASVREKSEISGNALVYTCSFEGIENIARELEFELS